MPPSLSKWIEECVTLCRPKNVHLCDGSKKESESLSQLLVEQGTFIPLNPKLRPGSFLARSHPQDVARVEEATFICSERQEDCGPTNHWQDPLTMKEKLRRLFSGSMEGRTLYILPFSMGPINSPFSKLGVEITDSAYVAYTMGLMTRMGKPALEAIKKGHPFVAALHSVGSPLKNGKKDTSWPCNPTQTCIAHFPKTQEIWSYGSGYGGNALLGKKCFALRIASYLGKQQGWLAEHMLILGLTNPQGKKIYLAAAFPSSCGKTNLAMLKPTLPGWKIETVGDDIAWIHVGKEGKLYAINPEFGYFGVAPGTSKSSNPYAMETIKSNTVFTNVALTKEGDVWWEGMTKTPPSHLIDWKGNPWTPLSKDKAAHPNSRFTVLASQSPLIDPKWEDPQGVPLSALLFGGRRASLTPLVSESFNWNHGVFFGASLSSEMTAAAQGEMGLLRNDPFAMLPFCGYHMGDYFQHWINLGKNQELKHLPKIFNVNWFRKNQAGKWLWPGYGENSRVLKWIMERVLGQVDALETPVGNIPKLEDFDFSHLSLNQEEKQALFAFNPKEWQEEAFHLETYFQQFNPKLPEELSQEILSLKKRLS